MSKLGIDNNRNKEEIYRQYKNSRNINGEIALRQREIEQINLEIQKLQNRTETLIFETDVLQEIKDSQKTFTEIDRKISEYLLKLKEKNNLNVWTETLNRDGDSVALSVISNKNATYTGTIILNHNKKRDFYRVDSELTISSILLNMAKEHKNLFKNVDEVKIAKEGKIFYSLEDSNNYIENIKTKYNTFFSADKAPIIKEFEDINKVKYNAYDFIQYDGLIIDDYEIIENEIAQEVEEVPF